MLNKLARAGAIVGAAVMTVTAVLQPPSLLHRSPTLQQTAIQALLQPIAKTMQI